MDVGCTLDLRLIIDLVCVGSYIRIARCLCGSWASCWQLTQYDQRILMRTFICNTPTTGARSKVLICRVEKRCSRMRIILSVTGR